MVPVMEFELSPEPIYLEGVVVIYPHLDEGYVLRLNQTALIQEQLCYRHDDMCSLVTMENLTGKTSTTIKEGPMRLGVYEFNTRQTIQF